MEPPAGRYDAVILAVGHREFAALGAGGSAPSAARRVLFDVKGVFPKFRHRRKAIRLEKFSLQERPWFIGYHVAKRLIAARG